MNRRALQIGLAEYISAYPKSEKHRPYGAMRLRDRFVLVSYYPIISKFGFADEGSGAERYRELRRSDRALAEHFREQNLRQIARDLEYLERNEAILLEPALHLSWRIARHTGKGVIALTDSERALLIELYRWLYEQHKRRIDDWLSKHSLDDIVLWQYWRDA